MIHTLEFEIRELIPYINWIYFYHAWGVKGAEAESLKAQALSRLDEWQQEGKTTLFRVGLFKANSQDEDIIIIGEDGQDERHIPLLRQQRPPYLCLADFVPPRGMKPHTIGIFASTTHIHADTLLDQTLADRLAEATAELGHKVTRTPLWGYAPDEDLTPEELFKERYQGKRPAVGYPSMPDQSLNFVLSEIINFASLGITLTESGAMIPHASTTGLMISLAQARHFAVGPISEEQLIDYAKRRNMTPEKLRIWLELN